MYLSKNSENLALEHWKEAIFSVGYEADGRSTT